MRGYLETFLFFIWGFYAFFIEVGSALPQTLFFSFYWAASKSLPFLFSKSGGTVAGDEFISVMWGNPKESRSLLEHTLHCHRYTTHTNMSTNVFKNTQMHACTHTHTTIPHICHFFYTGRIFESQIFTPKLQQIPPKSVKYAVPSVQSQKKLHRTNFFHGHGPWCLWQIWGMHTT